MVKKNLFKESCRKYGVPVIEEYKESEIENILTKDYRISNIPLSNASIIVSYPLSEFT